MYKDIYEFAKLYKDMDVASIKTQIRKKRRELEYSPKEIARRIGCSSETYQQLEKLSYRYKPSLESLINVCYAMHVTLFELMDIPYENNPTNGDK